MLQEQQWRDRSSKSGTHLVDHKGTFYADDSAFIFLSKTDLIKGTEFVRSSFAQFGLEVHLGTRANNAKSKTEAMYFPSHSNSRMKYLRISLTETSISQTENLYCLQTNSNTSELTSLRTYQMTPTSSSESPQQRRTLMPSAEQSSETARSNSN